MSATIEVVSKRVQTLSVPGETIGSAPVLKPLLGLFVKKPEPGLVKTRLAAAIGGQSAARLYRAFVTDLINRCRDFQGRRVLAFTPNDAEARSEYEQLAVGDYELWAQPSGSLGDRLQSFFDSFATSPTIVIGSDSPTLPLPLIEEAADRLNQVEVTLGPASDGGVYLIGLDGRSQSEPSVQQRLFANIDWSTSRVCQQLCRNASEIAATFELMAEWYDVDEPLDLDRLMIELGENSSPEPSRLAATPSIGPADSPATRAVLDDFVRQRRL